MTGDDHDISRDRAALGVAIVLAAAAWLRFQGLDWDQGHHLHPDERFLTMVENAISGPGSFAQYLDTAHSPLNPANRGYRFFVYGTLPLFVVRWLGALLDAADYGRVHLVGRACSGLFDLGTVALTYALGRQVAGRRVGLIACALAAFSVTSIQNAHFFTVDGPGTFFATAALVALVGFARTGSVVAEVGFGFLLACAVGCRVNLALMAITFPVAFLYACARHRAFARIAAGGVVAVLLGFVTFRLVQPYAFAGPGFFSIALAPSFTGSMAEIRGMVAGEVHFPPSIQWIGRIPILFPAKNLLGWGIGPAWGLAVLLGLAFAFSPRAARARDEHGIGRGVLAWGVLFFGYHAWQFAPTGRYFLPIVPVLALSAAWMLGAGSGRGRKAATITVVAATCLWAVAFTAIYRRPVTRVEASRWIYANVPADKTVSIEHWDDGLPLGLADVPRPPYRTIELHLFDDDDEAKRTQLVDQLAEIDTVILSSNRLYRTIPREPWRYPMARRYYELLFSGELGFDLVRSFTSYPRIGPLEIPDDDAEEAFTVYDHPRVLIFAKTDRFSRERAAELLGAVSLAGIQKLTPLESSRLYRARQPSDVPVPSLERVAVRAYPVTSPEALARWLLVVEIVSLAFLALLARPFAEAPDRGFPLAKLLAWLAPGYLAWLVASSGLAPAGEPLARGVATILVLLGALVGGRDRARLGESLRTAAREIALVEVAFLVAFAIFLAARAWNPAVYWGEKPMDFAILNALSRARAMPPPDPWFAGGTLNYFYFGHALVACFGQIAGVAPEMAFNLAIATVAGLLASAAFAFGRRVGGGPAAGFAAAFAVVLIGNLAGLRIFLSAPHRHWNFDYYWSISRVIEGTINEFPSWNLLFADLHAHVLAQPFEVALLLVGSWWGGTAAPPRLLVVLLAGWLLGTVSATSAWSMPGVVLLQLAFVVTAWRSRERRTLGSLAAAVGAWMVAVLLSRVLFAPFWWHYRQPVHGDAGFGWERGQAPLVDVLTIFGVFLVALVPVLAVRLVAACREYRRPARARAAVTASIAGAAAIASLRSPSAGLFAGFAALGAWVWLLDTTLELRIVGALVAVAGAFGLGTELVYAWDRMNTVFKFYLQAWLLLGCAAGVAARVAWRSRGAWRVPWAVGTAAAAIAGSFTIVSGGMGLLRSPFVPSDVPTLDGMNYLEHTRPHEREAFRWIRHAVAGVPVILEAHGDSYGEFGRVSMNTGLPTVLGWEYHLFQQSHDWQDIYARRDDVQTLYSTTDLELAAALMKKYSIDLVFVGALERRTYPAEGLAKFGSWPVTTQVFQRGEVSVYARPGLLSSEKTWIEEAGPGPAIPVAAPLGAFAEPRDLAAGVDGTLWVVDFGHGRIQHLDAARKAIAAFGSPGEPAGQFHDPCGIAIGADGSLYVADTWNHRVQKLAANGQPIAEWSAGFYGPRGVAVDRLGRIYVADTGNNRVVRLDPRGGVERSWGKEGDVLSQPVGIAIGPRDEVFVADVGHKRVAVFSRDGELLRAWPIDGWNPPALVEPHLDVGKDGTVWVADPSGNRVLLFDSTGKPLGVALPSSPLSVPIGIAVTDAMHAAVTNAGSHSIAVVARTANTSVVPAR